MNSEIEAKFFISHDVVRSKLKEHNAELLHPSRTMKRVVIHTDAMTKKNAFIRIRDEGHRVTVTYKQFKNDSVDGAYESEIIVDDFDSAVSIFNESGLKYDTFQESKRENWKIGEVEVMLDSWPWLEDFIEIEAQSETELRDLASKLQLEWSDAIFGGVANMYLAQYPHIGNEGIKEINHDWKVMRFDDEPPYLLTNLVS